MGISSPRLYALPECNVSLIDARSLILVRLDNGAVAAVDAQWRTFLEHLKVFRSLADHARAITSKHPELQGQEKAIEANLQQLSASGIFYAADEVTAQIAACRPPNPPSLPPLTICIRTCDRPDFLQQLLASLVANAQAFGHRWPIAILEDSRNADLRDRNCEIAQRFADSLSLEYLGIDQQQAFVAELALVFPEHEASLRWLLDPLHPDNQHAPSHGRLYNLAFLLHAGQRILLLDDDALINAWQWPDSSQTPKFALTGGGTYPFLSAQGAFERLTPYGEDPLAEHDNYLGQPLADVMSSMGRGLLSPSCVANQPFYVAPHPYAHPGRIRYTHNGSVGDSGTTVDQHLLYSLHYFLPELIVNPAAYLEFKAAPRCLSNIARTPTLLGGTHFQHTTCAGFDLTELMPPVIPRERGEDGLFGALLRLLYPQDYGLHLPFGMEHRITEAHPWQLSGDFTQDPSSILKDWVNQLAAPAEVTPVQRLRLLVDSVLMAQSDGFLTERLHQMHKTQTLVSKAEQFSLVQAALAETRVTTRHGEHIIASQSPWRSDLMAISKKLLGQLQHPERVALEPTLIAKHASTIVQFVQCITAWQLAFAHCQQRKCKTAPPPAA